MTRKAVLLCVVVCLITACHVSGTEIFFDANSDLIPDTNWTIGLGQEVVLSVYLKGFTGQTGSFQFDAFYDGPVLSLLDYDTYFGQPDADLGLTGSIQTKAELGSWATSQWSSPVTQEINAFDSGQGKMREFYTGGSLTQTTTGDGILAYLVFEGASTGQTTVDLRKPNNTWFLEGVTIQPVPMNITITVIPEPSVVLMAIAFAVMLVRSRRCG